MGFFDFFRPDSDKNKNEEQSPNIVGEFRKPKNQDLTDSCVGYNPNLPSTMCSECGKIRNTPGVYTGPLYPCSECLGKKRLKEDELRNDIKSVRNTVEEISTKVNTLQGMVNTITSLLIENQKPYSKCSGLNPYWDGCNCGAVRSGFVERSLTRNYRGQSSVSGQSVSVASGQSCNIQHGRLRSDCI